MSKSRWRYRLTTTDPAGNGRRPTPTCRCELVGRPSMPTSTRRSTLSWRASTSTRSRFLILPSSDCRGTRSRDHRTARHRCQPGPGVAPQAVGSSRPPLLGQRHIGHLQPALDQLGLDLESSPQVPVHGPDAATWAGLGDTRRWRADGLEVLTQDVVGGHAFLLDQCIGEERSQRLNEVCKQALSSDLEPSDDEAAAWIEGVAKGLEAASLRQMESLPERRCQGVRTAPGKRTLRPVHPVPERKLRRSGPWEAAQASPSEPTVFIPPQPTTASRDSEDAELSTVPKNLQRAITFLHEEIKIRTRTGRTSPANSCR